MKPRLACVGHGVYFENHFCEKSSGVFDVHWVEFDHYSHDHYRSLASIRPDVTLIFRPELHDSNRLAAIPGVKIGVSSEPLPKKSGGQILRSPETDRRLATFRQLQRGAFDALYHYDEASRKFCEEAGIYFDGYRPLPINTDLFRRRRQRKLWDTVFVGKATPRRMQMINRLKSSSRPLLWVEHGVTGRALAALFLRAKSVLNIHADDLAALEPRVYLAAACGVPVISERTGAAGYPFNDFVVESDLTELSWDQIDAAAEAIVAETRHISDAEMEVRLSAASVTTYVVDALQEVLRWR